MRKGFRRIILETFPGSFWDFSDQSSERLYTSKRWRYRAISGDKIPGIGTMWIYYINDSLSWEIYINSDHQRGIKHNGKTLEECLKKHALDLVVLCSKLFVSASCAMKAASKQPGQEVGRLPGEEESFYAPFM